MNRLVPMYLEARDDLSAAHLAALAAALDGSGPAVAPTSAALTEREVPDGVAAVVRTSGSGGEPREVMLGAAALESSARAAHDRLGGPGRWLLALPPQHAAGLQVMVRSIVAGTEPAVLPAVTETDVLRAARIPGLPLYASLVPTQLHRILAGAGPDGALPPALRPWADLDAILVGGAATPPGLLDRARAAGLRVVTTYGMTETCGGCVYDGAPLAGVRVRIDSGAIRLAGPVLAHGYLDRPDLDAEAFETVDGIRWFRTADTGLLADDGGLRVLGRLDDVIVTGGVKVAPVSVEELLSLDPDVAEACVVPVADAEWGQVVAAVVVPAPGSPGPDLDRLRALVGRTLGPAAAPRRLVITDALPQRGPGKVDRAAAARLIPGT